MNANTSRLIIREARCEQMTGFSRWTRLRLEGQGSFPKRVKLGLKAVGWFEDEITDWQQARARGEKWRAADHQPLATERAKRGVTTADVTEIS